MSTENDSNPISIDEQERALRAAEAKALALFDECVRRRLAVAGMTERELSHAVFELAHEMFGTKRYWHKRIVRAGANTIHPYAENPPDRTIEADDILFFDFGPVFDDWEADVGRTFVLGDDPHKHRLAADAALAWDRGAEHYLAHADVTGAELYAFIEQLAVDAGWTYGQYHCGHLIGRFPHEQREGDDISRYMRAENTTPLRGLGTSGDPLRWILEIHFVDRERGIGAFHEGLLPLAR